MKLKYKFQTRSFRKKYVEFDFQRKAAKKKPKTQKAYKDVPKITPPKSERDQFLEGYDFSYIDDHAMKVCTY